MLTLATLAGLLASQRAQGQQLDLALASPAPGQALTLTLPTPTPARHGTLNLGLFVDYAHGLLDRSVSCAANTADGACVAASSKTVRGAVSDQGQSVLLLDIGLFDALGLGVALPVSVTRATPIGSDAPKTQAGFGDVRLALKGAFVGRDSTRVGWSVQLSLPSATHDTWSGERGATLLPALVVSQELGHVMLVAQAAYHLRRRSVFLGVEQDDAFVLGVGANYAVARAVAVLAEFNARLGVGGRSFDAAQAPAEIDLGLRLGRADGPMVDLGVGTRAWPGERGAGAPALRGFVALRLAVDVARCAYGPEDYDGFQDADGCGDPDNDRDGVADGQDACPNDAEDHDRFADADGCPDRDNDADGLIDARDLCPERSEDRDGFQDQDGCPEPDNDADAVADGRDQCPLDPEDRDGFEDTDGCPEPGPGQPTVTVSGSRLLLSDRIYFEDEADTIRAVSTVALDAMAGTLKTLPARPRVRVEGHTDDSGNAQYNLDLSYRRARAVVEYLKARGVHADQLEYVGRGSAVPLAPNSSPEGRAMNRRVEFVVIDR